MNKDSRKYLLGLGEKRILALLLVFLFPYFLTSCTRQSQANKVIRIGYQKWGTFSILKVSGELQRSLDSKGLRIEWLEFPAGPPLLEALNAGSIDLGHTGDSPPLFAQAAGVPFRYFAVSSASPQSSAILVKESSPIKNAADLRGRKIGIAKGTSAHTMVLRYLEKNGLGFSDINPVYLSPADGRIALESDSIDAWSIWDPYLAAAQYLGGLRVLASGDGFVDGREFYLASEKFIDQQPELLDLFVSELSRVKSWAKSNPDTVNQFLVDETKLPLAAVSLAESRRNRYDTQAIGEAIVISQQELADRYFELGLLPKKIHVQDAVIAPPTNEEE